MQFFENSADTEHRAGRKLAAGKIRDQPIESRARLIVLIVMPVDQRQSLERRGRIRSARRDLQIFENRLFGALGLRLERSRRNPDQLRANSSLRRHRESRVRLLVGLGQRALAQEQLSFVVMVRERVGVGDAGIRRENGLHQRASFRI